MKKPSIDYAGLEEDTKERLEKENVEKTLEYRGINGDTLIEAICPYITSPCERVYRHGDVHLVFGRDRPGHRTSGYGAKGDTKAHSLDVVVGRMGYQGREVDDSGEQIFVDPSFEYDAARIHVSQKTDIDDNFGLVDGGMERVQGKSGLGMKADAVRVMSRGGGIKLVTGVDPVNSRGGKINKVEGVSLVAGNNDKDLQPIILGDNAVEALSKIVDHIEKLSAVVDGLLVEQTKLNQELITHTHLSPFFAQPTLPSESLLTKGPMVIANHLAKTKESLIALKINLASLKNTYFSEAGSKSISSRYNQSN